MIWTMHAFQSLLHLSGTTNILFWNEALARERICEKATELHLEHNRHLAEDEAARRVSEGTAILNFLFLVREKGQFFLLSP